MFRVESGPHRGPIWEHWSAEIPHREECRERRLRWEPARGRSNGSRRRWGPYAEDRRGETLQRKQRRQRDRATAKGERREGEGSRRGR